MKPDGNTLVMDIGYVRLRLALSWPKLVCRYSAFLAHVRPFLQD